MADLISYGNAHRDTEQALIALKKGTHLLKYGRKGKPKFCPFRLSHDESSLIWISSSGERSLKLALVSRIIPGQRTAVFQRYLRPDKDYLSFSLIYNNGKRSLDLVCKDKVEAEVWIAGLKALISSKQGGRSKIDGWSEGGLYIDIDSLRHKYESQEAELKRSRKQAQEAMVLAAEDSAKFTAAKDVIKSLTSQLKDLAERLPPGSYDFDSIKIPNNLESDFTIQNPDTNGNNNSMSNLVNTSSLISPIDTSAAAASASGLTEAFTETKESIRTSDENDCYSDARSLNGSAGVDLGKKFLSDNVASQEGRNNGFKTRNLASNGNNTYNAPDQIEAEWSEQYEPGVYITLVALRDGTRDLKRVRFSRRRFGEHQAETWWSENRENVYERYNIRGSDKSSVSAQTARQSAESLPSPPQY